MKNDSPILIVRHALRLKVWAITLAGILVAVICVLFLKAQSVGRIVIGIFVVYLIWWASRSSDMRLLLHPFRDALVIYSHGIQFVGCDVLVEWEQIQEIVVFTYDGRKHFGFRLKDDVSALQGKRIDECMKGNPSWFMFRMPFATMYKGLSTHPDEIIEMLHSRYGLDVRYNTRDLGFGQEADI